MSKVIGHLFKLILSTVSYSSFFSCRPMCVHESMTRFYFVLLIFILNLFYNFLLLFSLQWSKRFLCRKINLELYSTISFTASYPSFRFMCLSLFTLKEIERNSITTICVWVWLNQSVFIQVNWITIESDQLLCSPFTLTTLTAYSVVLMLSNSLLFMHWLTLPCSFVKWICI